MAEKYNVGLPLGTEETNSDAINKFISPKHAGLIPRSVRLEITQKGKLLDAPSKDLVEACLLLADISGFTALGEKLTKEHGDARGAEEFASQMSAAISALGTITSQAVISRSPNTFLSSVRSWLSSSSGLDSSSINSSNVSLTLEGVGTMLKN